MATTERYHKAARDGYLEALKEGTKRDLNSRDEDGMTPTLWAAFEGNLDALRLIVGRGGDPDKSDNYGNSALHFAAARGHMHCVSFLVNFGVNMWALDVDFHTPKDLAAINNKEEILRFLDAALSKEEAKDKKKVKSLQEKAEKEAQKRVKEFDKLQKKASKTVEEEERKLAKQRQKMERNGGTVNPQPPTARPTLPFMSLRNKEPKTQSQSPKFSEIVSSSNQPSTAGTIVNKLRPTHLTGVYKKVQQRKTLSSGTAISGPDFKVAEVESNGKRSVRSLSGLKRDSEVMYVPKYEIPGGGAGRRGKINGLFDEDEMSSCGLTRSLSQPDYLNEDSPAERGQRKHSGGTTEAEFYDDQRLPHNSTSIFERPGFGSVAFRSSLSSAYANFQKNSRIEEADGIVHREIGVVAEEDDFASDEEAEDSEKGPVELFLAAAGIPSYIPLFRREKIDLDALIQLTEEDLGRLGIPSGPRRILLESIQERQYVLENPGEIIDSRL